MLIRDITTACAGPDFRYRVLVRPQIPHVGNVEIGPDHVNLRAGGSRPLTVATRQQHERRRSDASTENSIHCWKARVLQ